MSWLEKLYKTYKCAENNEPTNGLKPLPICHTTQNAQIEVIIDVCGNFRSANVIPKSDAATIIPCTEESGGRAGSKPTSHPLCDKLQYLAGDFSKFGGRVTTGFSKDPAEPHRIYLELLSKWCSSPYSYYKVEAILKYVQKSTLIEDLIHEGVLIQDFVDGQLIKQWNGSPAETPEIFKAMQNKSAPEEAFVRWIVENPSDQSRKIWEDNLCAQSWIDYYLTTKTTLGLCYVLGEVIPLTKQHPAKIRHAADKAKLISANDKDGFTFRGRFTDKTGLQACGVGYEVTQKGHNALRWLIERQGYRNGNQAVVAWETKSKPIPDPLFDTLRMLCIEDEIESGNFKLDECSSFLAGQEFALRFKDKIRGYRKELGDASDIVVLALNSATTGRMAITYYRELQSSEFLNRIEAWHERCCWFQNFGKKRQFFGAPSPKDIAEVAFGKRLDEKILNSTILTLLPCILDESPLPRYLVESCIRRASNKNGIEQWEWEKALGVACAVYCKQKNNERKYQMSLETEYTSRDYLYGRLLALAEEIERQALRLAKENRETNAGKYMQRFASYPYTTWPNIVTALQPYEMRLRAKRPAFLKKMQREIDTVMSAFKKEDFISDAKLTGEFLLGYHCQRNALRQNYYKKMNGPSVESEVVNESN